MVGEERSSVPSFVKSPCVSVTENSEHHLGTFPIFQLQLKNGPEALRLTNFDRPVGVPSQAARQGWAPHWLGASSPALAPPKLAVESTQPVTVFRFLEQPFHLHALLVTNTSPACLDLNRQRTMQRHYTLVLLGALTPLTAVAAGSLPRGVGPECQSIPSRQILLSFHTRLTCFVP